MKNLKSILAICTVAVMIASCQKDEVQGPQGPQGPQGQQGASGPQGPEGNANVTSITVSVSSSDWVLYSNSLGGYDWAAQKYVSQISSSIVSTGAVMVYMKRSYSNGGYYYQALPFSWVVNSNSTRSYGFSISTTTLNIHVEDTDNSLSGLGTYTFKVVIIDGNRLAANPHVNLNNYEEVKNTFHLAD